MEYLGQNNYNEKQTNEDEKWDKSNNFMASKLLVSDLVNNDPSQ